MADISRTLAQMRQSPKNVRFSDLRKVCEHYFGPARQHASHVIFKMPWKGDPRINIQSKGSKAKPYQVNQVLNAIKKLEKLKAGERQ